MDMESLEQNFLSGHSLKAGTRGSWYSFGAFADNSMSYEPKADPGLVTGTGQIGAVFEYRVYEMVPWLLREYLKVVDESLQQIRRDQYGRLVGFWCSELSGCCSVHHLWEYASLDRRQEARRELLLLDEWNAFLKKAAPAIKNQAIAFLRLHGAICPSEQPAGLYELIRYQAKVGQAARLAEAVRYRPRAPESSLVAIWTADAPDPNEVFELVSFSSLGSRETENVYAPAQTGWWLAQHQLIQSHRSCLLSPQRISPLS